MFNKNIFSNKLKFSWRGRGFFYQVKGTWGGVILTIRTSFCEYWTSIKIKINMTYVPKEYEMKTKKEHAVFIRL